MKMQTHHLLRIGDGIHFIASSSKNIWGINSKHSWCNKFIKEAKAGDILWFVKSGEKGIIIAVATFTVRTQRVLGPLIQLTHTNEELGWTKTEGDWDVEVHYKDLYNVSLCKLYSEIKSPLVIRQYNREKCKLDLPVEYSNIVRYSKITNKM